MGDSTRTITMDDFTSIKVIGKGSYGKVMLVRKNDSGELFAMKILKKEHIAKRNQIAHTLTERSILERVSHPFIIKLRYAFQSAQKLYFVLEYCQGGELFFHLSRIGHFDENRTKFYAGCIILALEQLHKLDVIYREQFIFSLKPENILIGTDGYAKITDFGLSREHIRDNHSATSFCGTPEYLAPEILAKTGHGKAVDWWSLGALIYEMMTGWPPFYNRDRQALFRSIQSEDFPPHVNISPIVNNLLHGLMNKNPSARLGSGPTGAQEIKSHEWFQSFDWDALLTKQLEPPFIPNISSPVDVSNFDEDFTRIPPNMSPPDVDMASPEGRFTGFSYKGSEAMDIDA